MTKNKTYLMVLLAVFVLLVSAVSVSANPGYPEGRGMFYMERTIGDDTVTYDYTPVYQQHGFFPVDPENVSGSICDVDMSNKQKASIFTYIVDGEAEEYVAVLNLDTMQYEMYTNDKCPEEVEISIDYPDAYAEDTETETVYPVSSIWQPFSDPALYQHEQCESCEHTDCLSETEYTPAEEYDGGDGSWVSFGEEPEELPVGEPVTMQIYLLDADGNVVDPNGVTLPYTGSWDYQWDGSDKVLSFSGNN